MQTDRSFFAAAAWALAVTLSAPGIGRAAVDLNGQWRIEAATTGDVFPGFAVSCAAVTVVQSGASLSVTGTCTVVGALAMSGTIDPATGTFTLAQAPAGICDSLDISATAAGDSYTFSGTFICMFGTLPVPGTVTGSRCGNGVLDPSEQCDHAAPGDCCDPTTCQFQAAGTGCAPDATECTDDVCNATGVCQHVSNTAPCDDGNECTTDVCGGGTCNGTPVPAGTRCNDHDACTTADACDASGACIGGPALACDPPCSTGVCDPHFGCVADVGTCDDPTGLGGKLSITDKTPDTRDKLSWAWAKGPAITLADLGSPTVDTTYTLCLSDLVYDSSFHVTPRSIHTMTAPAGSRWLPTSRGFQYVDKSGTPNGLSAITLVSGVTGKAKIKVKGKGANLFLPKLGPIDAALVSALPLVQLKASNGRCWDTPELQLISVGNGKLKAKGSPSGAFVD